MQEPILKFLDVFFFVFHTVIILFNAFGWVVKRWRFIHLIVLLLTAFSWFVLGIWYGWGYCLCTDWHWQVRETLGYNDMSSSYVHFLLLKITKMNISTSIVDSMTAIFFFSALAISFYLNFKKWIRK